MKNAGFFAYAHIHYIYRDKESSKSRKGPLISRKLQMSLLNHILILSLNWIIILRL
jgi:hypothetical protein